jgi:hypothetical protein
MGDELEAIWEDSFLITVFKNPRFNMIFLGALVLFFLFIAGFQWLNSSSRDPMFYFVLFIVGGILLFSFFSDMLFWRPVQVFPDGIRINNNEWIESRGPFFLLSYGFGLAKAGGEDSIFIQKDNVRQIEVVKRRKEYYVVISDQTKTYGSMIFRPLPFRAAIKKIGLGDKITSFPDYVYFTKTTP